MNVSQKFWDVSLANITLLPMTAKSFTDDEVMVPAVEWMLEVNTTEAQRIIDVVQEAMLKYPAIGSQFPMWSLNAMALGSDPTMPSEFVNVPAVLMGDGFTMFLRSYRLAEAGADFVLFHELGHHLQFGMNISEFYQDGMDPARYVELLADSYAAYFAHHPRGATFQTKRILQASQTAFSIGDCYLNETGHHGTPNQRSKAVLFAAKLIDNSKEKGKKLKAAEFKAEFDAVYRSIVAPDM
jgi:hypothetical protein